MPQVVFNIAWYIHTAPTAVLQFLSLECFYSHKIAFREAEQQEASKFARARLGESLLPSDMSKWSQLRSVELRGLNTHLSPVVDRILPHVSTLTQLFLAGGTTPLPAHAISAMLLANAQLESLSLDVSGAHLESEPSTPILLAALQVQLPLLSYFSLNVGSKHEWGLEILQIIDAPNLEYFLLDANVPNYTRPRGPGAWKLFQYLSRGRTNGDLRCDSMLGDEVLPSEPIFPSLRHVDLRNICGHYSGVLILLCAFPMTTKVTLSPACLKALAEQPELLPHATHFVITWASLTILEPMHSVATRRADAGTPISLLEVEVHRPSRPSYILESKHLSDVLETKDHELNKKFIAPLRRSVGRFEVYYHYHDVEVLLEPNPGYQGTPPDSQEDSDSGYD